uniref:SET domain-containing protein n=1 Tax=Alexandrium catenella TaxID=2925 RepID=A0A7S1R8A2_ALECA
MAQAASAHDARSGAAPALLAPMAGVLDGEPPMEAAGAGPPSDDAMLVPTEVREESTIPGAGRGRFVLRSVEKGEAIRRLRIGSPALRAFRSVEEIEAAFPRSDGGVQHVSHFGASAPPDVDWLREVVLVNGTAACLNHPPRGTEPNVRLEYRIEGGEQFRFLVAVRDIPAGGEMFVDYTQWSEVPWFEEYLRSNGLQSARGFAVGLGEPARDAGTA